jgi:hypothetical protein
MENWKEIKDYEGLYECSTHGRVRTVARVVICRNGMPKSVRQKILTPHFNSNGYLWVYLWKNRVKRFWLVHRLIALSFVANPDNKPFVNHKSGSKTDNVPDLLEWSTRKENVAHAFATGLMSHAGERNSQSKLTAEKVRQIRSECPPGTRITFVLAENYGISKRRLHDVINDPSCWKDVKVA